MKYRHVITGVHDKRGAIDYFRKAGPNEVGLQEALEMTRGPFPMYGEWHDGYFSMIGLTTAMVEQHERLAKQGRAIAPDEEEYTYIPPCFESHFEYVYTDEEKARIAEILAEKRKLDAALQWYNQQPPDIRVMIDLVVEAKTPCVMG